MTSATPAGTSPLVSWVDRKELRPFFERVRSRFVTRSGTGATVEVRDGEREALRGLFGRRLTKRSLHLRRLEDALVESGFTCTSLREALDTLFDEPVVTRKEKRARRASAWQDAREGLDEVIGDGPCAEVPAAWVEAEESYLRSQWSRSRRSFLPAVTVAIDALRHADGGREIRLAVLANRVAGDPHALDRSRNGGMPAAARYFRSLLRHLHPDITGKGLPAAEEWAELLAARGILLDDISSDVTVSGLLGDIPVLAAARAGGDVLKLTSRNLEDWEGHSLRAADGVAFLVENPPVFSDLHDAIQHHPPEVHPTVVCVSGNPSLAVRTLLERLVASGCKLRYSGDFDERGVGIARFLLDRYGGACHLWRMGPDDYKRALGTTLATPDSVPGLSGLEVLINRHGPAYQEALVSRLTEDLIHQVMLRIRLPDLRSRNLPPT